MAIVTGEGLNFLKKVMIELESKVKLSRLDDSLTMSCFQL